MVRAAALSYAIVFALLVGLICSGILFIFATQKKLEVIAISKEYLLTDSYSAIRLGMFSDSDSTFYIHPSGDTSFITRHDWGFLKVVHTTTRKGNFEKQRTAFVAREGSYPYCLVIPGNNGGVKIGGESLLEGDICIPNGLIEQAYSGTYKRSKLVYGSVEKSELFLPQPAIDLPKLSESLIPGRVQRIDRLVDSNFLFSFPTSYYKSNSAIEISAKMRGNLIIESADSIVVSAEAVLQDVVLIAPKICFRKGFRGNLQAFASKNIRCEENVSLEYPSALAIIHKEEDKDPATIELRGNSEVFGAVVNYRKEPDFQHPDVICFNDSTRIAGLVYCTGQTEIKGSVIGFVITSQLISNIGGGTYTNQLIGGKISSEKLPEDFLFLFLPAENQRKQKVLKWLRK